VRFTDGRIRQNVQRTELLSNSNWECDVWNEQIRLLHGEQANTRMLGAFYDHCRANVDISEKHSISQNFKKRALPSVTNETPTTIKSDFYQQRKSRRLSPRLTLQELFYHRCGTCHLCRSPDCGECESCHINRTTTSRHRQVCIIHMCIKIPIASKQQPSLYGWDYYFYTPFTQRTPSICGLHLCYQQLRLVASSPVVNQGNHDPKAKSLSIFSVLHSLVSDEQRVKFGSFFESLTGQPLRERCSHPLISNKYMHEYSNRDVTCTILTGTIKKCWKHFIHRTLSFAVKFDKCQSIAANLPTDSSESRTSGSSTFLIEETVSEQMAWGGYQKYSCSALEENQNRLAAPYFYVDWMTPSKRHILESYHRYPCLMLECRNCLLQFEAKASRIKGAGTGLFVKVINGKDLVLQPGEMLDLGIYAPLKATDIKTKHVSILKNLIFEWSMETWSFAGKTKSPETCIFDPTDDFTGTRDFNESVISFVNETCQIDEIANVSAQYDPEGNVHYLLGHWEEREGTLTISSDGKPMELLVRFEGRSSLR
jgi:hypothetical protein